MDTAVLRRATMLLMGMVLVCSQAFAVDPVHFVFTSNTGDSYSVLILSAKIGDVDLAVGDEIGVFTPEGLCAGAVVWEGAAAGLAAWVDDSQTPEVIDGFRAGEEMSFKVWNQSTDQELEATATYLEGDGKYGTGSSAVVNLVASPLPVLMSIEVSPDSVDIMVGDMQQFTAIGKYTSGPDSVLTNRVTWTSSDTLVATITGAGVATGKYAGQTAIRAVYQGKEDTAKLKVTPIEEPDIEVVPLALAFGDVAVGGTSTKDVTVSNVGNADLHVTGITLTGAAQFSRMDGVGVPFTLVSGADTTLTVQFAPDAVAMFTGTLTIASDDPDEASVVIALNGNGVEELLVKVALPQISAQSGQIVLIPVHIDIDGLDQVPVSSCEMVITYDSDVVRVLETTTIGTFAEGWSTDYGIYRSIHTSTDTISIAMATSVDTLSGSCTLVFLRAIVSEYAAIGDSSALTFESFLLNDGSPMVELQDGVLRVVSLLGDVSGNGKAGAFDASLILREIVGLVTLPDPEWPAFTLVTGDVSGNGTLSALDAAYILRYTVGLIDRFPTGGVEDKVVVRGERIVSLGDVQHTSDGHIVVPLTIDEMDDVLAGEMTLFFEGNAGDVTVRTSELTSNYLLAHNVQDGRIRASFAGAESSAGPGPVLEVVFNASDLELLSTLRLEQVSLNEGRIPVRIEGVESETPKAYRLSQNYPNPFNPETTISYDVVKTSTVRLSVYALTGQLVRTLVDGERPAGRYSVVWDGKDDAGRDAASGVYLCRMVAGEYSAVRKLLLMK